MAYAFHDFWVGCVEAVNGDCKKILHLNLCIKEIKNIFGADRRKAAGHFIREGFFAARFSG